MKTYQVTFQSPKNESDVEYYLWPWRFGKDILWAKDQIN